MFSFRFWFGLVAALFIMKSAGAGPILGTEQTEDSEVSAYCQEKIAWMRSVYRNRDAGVPMQAQIRDLWARYEKRKDPDTVKRRFVYVDFERIIRDAYRKSSNGAFVHDFMRQAGTESADCLQWQF